MSLSDAEVYGTLTAAVVLNLILWTLEFVMACQFFGRKRTSGASPGMKFVVFLTLLLDTAATAASCAFLYEFQRSDWATIPGEDEDDENQTDDVHTRFWQLLIAVLMVSAFSSAIAQSFLLQRFWKNIRHHLFGTVFAVCLLIMALLASIAAIVVCGYLRLSNTETDFAPFVWTALVASAISAAGITTISICQRFAMKTVGLKINFFIRAWRAFVDTGIPSAIIVFLALIAWADHQASEYVIALFFLQARVYSCSMLYALRHTPVRTDGLIHDLVTTSVPQKSLPLPAPVPPLSPDIFLRADKTGRISDAGTIPVGLRGNTPGLQLPLPEMPDEKVAAQRWYNIDLGDGSRESMDQGEREAASQARAGEGALIPVQTRSGSPAAAVALHRSASARKPVPAPLPPMLYGVTSIPEDDERVEESEHEKKEETQ